MCVIEVEFAHSSAIVGSRSWSRMVLSPILIPQLSDWLSDRGYYPFFKKDFQKMTVDPGVYIPRLNAFDDPVHALETHSPNLSSLSIDSIELNPLINRNLNFSTQNTLAQSSAAAQGFADVNQMIIINSVRFTFDGQQQDKDMTRISKNSPPKGMVMSQPTYQNS